MGRVRLTDAEREVRRRERSAHSFSNVAYRHYDTSKGFGSWQEWSETAEERAAGRGYFRGTRTHADRNIGLLRLLGLEVMPLTVVELKSAFRRAAFVAHPDHGGSEAEFIKVFEAYEKLVRLF